MKKTVVFIFLTLALIGLIIDKGIPFLIQMAGFFGDLKSSKELVENEDQTPPSPPRLQALPEATNDPYITLKGFAEAGTTVKIFLNAELVKEVISDNDASFIVDSLFLNSGKNRLQAKAIDQAGNESEDSVIMIIDYDNQAPALEVNQPEPAEKVKISGKTEMEATLKINDHLVILDQEGSFTYPLDLQEGENKILVSATDQAGNQTKKEFILNYAP